MQRLFFIFILQGAMSITALAQTDLLNGYLKIAAENNPGVKADFLLYQAALQKVPQAGAWQDPQLDLGFFLQPMEIIDGKQVADIKLMQMFPWFGTRKAARTEMQAMAKMAYEQFRETRDQLWLEVYTQWYTLGRLQQQLTNNQENKKLLEQLEALALQKFSAGNAGAGASKGERRREKGESNTPAANNGMSGMNMGGSSLPAAANSVSTTAGMGGMNMNALSASGMSEVLRIQLEMMELDNSMESLLSEIQAEKAKFNTLLNRPVKSEIQIPDSLQQIPFLWDEIYARTQIKQNPMLGMIREEESAYQAKAEMDRKMSYPMLGVGLQYMLINKKPAAVDAHSGMETMNDMNGKDMLMPMLSVSIPIYRNKYKAQQRENMFLQQASREKYTNTLNLLEAELVRIQSDLDNVARKITLYHRQSELAQTTYNLAVQEFASGKSDLSAIIQIQRQLLDYQLKEAEAIAGYNTMAVTIQKIMSLYENKE